MSEMAPAPSAPSVEVSAPVPVEAPVGSAPEVSSVPESSEGQSGDRSSPSYDTGDTATDAAVTTMQSEPADIEAGMMDFVNQTPASADSTFDPGKEYAELLPQKATLLLQENSTDKADTITQTPEHVTQSDPNLAVHEAKLQEIINIYDHIADPGAKRTAIEAKWNEYIESYKNNKENTSSETSGDQQQVIDRDAALSQNRTIFAENPAEEQALRIKYADLPVEEARQKIEDELRGEIEKVSQEVIPPAQTIENSPLKAPKDEGALDTGNENQVVEIPQNTAEQNQQLAVEQVNLENDKKFKPEMVEMVDIGISLAGLHASQEQINDIKNFLVANPDHITSLEGILKGGAEAVRKAESEAKQRLENAKTPEEKKKMSWWLKIIQGILIVLAATAVTAGDMK